MPDNTPPYPKAPKARVGDGPKEPIVGAAMRSMVEQTDIPNLAQYYIRRSELRRREYPRSAASTRKAGKSMSGRR